jgi:outer membrane protein OmpA-like peptidoglycan-associated protein
MRVFLLGFLVFLAFALVSRWYFVCKIRHHCEEQPPVASRPMTLSFKDGEKVILQGYEQFGFAPNSFNPEMSDNNRQFLEKVADYLQRFPDRNLTITGRFLESEKTADSGIFENLGIARAGVIEHLLAKMGVDEKRISIDYQMVKGNAPDEPLSFHSFLPADQPEAYEKLEFKFTDNTFSDANFEFNSDAFRPGERCVLYADSVKKYLDVHPEMMLSIIGHTDSVGVEKYNYDLGLRRAKNASEYFRELGVKAKINVSSKGEAQPVAPNSLPNGNDNPDGRQRNRRVNFKIEQQPK